MANHSVTNRKQHTAVDPLWQEIRAEVTLECEREPLLAGLLYAGLLNHQSMEDALIFNLAEKLAAATISALTLRELFAQAYDADPELGKSLRADVRAVRERDPAATRYWHPFLFYKGFLALQSHRIAHWLWQNERPGLAMFLQSRNSEVFSVDIHPGARIGNGVMFDHATGLVIGETAVVEDNVSILHEVTLGGTGKGTGDRHPKVRRGVLIGAGTQILGNVEVGKVRKSARVALSCRTYPHA